MHRALFLCSRNRLRSPTAERVFAAWPGVETDSAGLSPDADCALSSDQLAWATIVFVMEEAHRRKLSSLFGPELRGKRVVCLDIPDDYAFMQPELVSLLEAKAGPLLRGAIPDRARRRGMPKRSAHVRATQVELEGSPLIGELSLVASQLRERGEVVVDDAWLSRHGATVCAAAAWRPRLVDALRGVGRRALANGEAMRLVLTVLGKPLCDVELELDGPAVRFVRPAS